MSTINDVLCEIQDLRAIRVSALSRINGEKVRLNNADEKIKSYVGDLAKALESYLTLSELDFLAQDISSFVKKKRKEESIKMISSLTNNAKV